MLSRDIVIPYIVWSCDTSEDVSIKFYLEYNFSILKMHLNMFHAICQQILVCPIVVGIHYTNRFNYQALDASIYMELNYLWSPIRSPLRIITRSPICNCHAMCRDLAFCQSFLCHQQQITASSVHKWARVLLRIKSRASPVLNSTYKIGAGIMELWCCLQRLVREFLCLTTTLTQVVLRYKEVWFTTCLWLFLCYLVDMFCLGTHLNFYRQRKM